MDQLTRLASRRVPPVEMVVEGFQDVGLLREMHAAGFVLFYGYGLPQKTVVFLEKEQGFTVNGTGGQAGPRLAPLRDPNDLYFRLLWRRFGNAVVVTGKIAQPDLRSGLLSVVSDEGQEHLCRLPRGAALSCPVGAKVEIFGWQKRGSRVLHVIEATLDR